VHDCIEVIVGSKQHSTTTTQLIPQQIWPGGGQEIGECTDHSERKQKPVQQLFFSSSLKQSRSLKEQQQTNWHGCSSNNKKIAFSYYNNLRTE
jgi:hypothetical protein